MLISDYKCCANIVNNCATHTTIVDIANNCANIANNCATHTTLLHLSTFPNYPPYK